MSNIVLKWGFLLAASWAIAGCYAFPEDAEQRSTKDRERRGSTVIRKMRVIINDSVSSPNRDRTDWRTVLAPCEGKLTVELHWDKSGNDLDLTLYNAMGAKIMDGQPWDVLGERGVLAVERAGTRYYVRVQARGEDDASTYALRLTPDCVSRGPKLECISPPCNPGEKKCLEEEGYLICEKKAPNCTVWSSLYACEKGAKCKDGECAKACDVCKVGAGKCLPGRKVRRCIKKDGCGAWGPAKRCGHGHVCSRGRCVKPGGPKPPKPKPPKPKPPKVTCIGGKVLTMYPYHGQQMLNIRITGSGSVKAGSTGYVLQGSTNAKLANGDFKVTRVSGHVCTATTNLSNLGIHRRVCIRSK